MFFWSSLPFSKTSGCWQFDCWFPWLKKKLLQDICFTILCWFLPCINMNQTQVCMCTLLLESPSHFPPRSTPLRCHRAPSWAPCESLSRVWLFATPWTTVNGILQARILVSVAFPYFRGSSQPRDQTQVSHCRWIFYQLSHRETLSSLYHTANSHWLSLFPYGNVYVSMLLSPFTPPSPSYTVSTSLLSMFASPLLPCK